jgi:hypothetical protein
VNWFGEVYEIDARTGNAVLAGAAGATASRSNSMAIDRSGTPYTTLPYGYPLNATYLVTLSRQNGLWLPTQGPMVFSDVSALAFSPSGTLFAIRRYGPTGNDLYTIDVETGAATAVGCTMLPGIQALDFSPEGILYGFDVGGGSGAGVGLVRIDPVTALASDVDPAVDGRAADVQTLAFAPDGTLYGAHENLFRVDLNTGALTLLGPIEGTYFGIRGMAWVPEPSTLAGLATLAAALLVHLCRRRKTES